MTRKPTASKRNGTAWGRLAGVLALGLFLATVARAQQPQVLRVGYFPNITHAQALIGQAQGQFEKALGPGVRVEWKAFNAGPSAIEALFADAIDLTYIGPNPAVSGYVQSRGEALRVIAGATSGGAALVVRADAGIQTPQDFHGKKIASPQLGNTQDVALRAWLASNGLKTREKGGDVQVIPIANPDQLTLFVQKSIDGAWAPEPWASRLIAEAGGRLYLDERTLWPGGKFVTAHLVASTKILKSNPELVKKWLRAHVELTDWIRAHPAEAKTLVNQQIEKQTRKALSPQVLDQAFARLEVTYDPVRTSLLASAKAQFEAGLLRAQPDLSGLYDLTLLNAVLAEKKREPIQ